MTQLSKRATKDTFVFWWKILATFLLMIVTVVISAVWYSNTLLNDIDSDITFSLTTDPFQDLLIRLIIVSTASISLGIFILVYDRNQLLNKINKKIKEAMYERKLTQHFDHLYSGTASSTILSNLQTTFNLFRSFDNMKSNRVSIETETLQTLIDHIDEGVLIVNKEKIAILTNHRAEQLLGLIPGEVIGQTLSRKVSYTDVLQMIDNALENDQKTRDQEIMLNDKTHTNITVYPIKNRQGEVIRAFVMFALSANPN